MYLCCSFEELRKKTTKVEKKKLMEDKEKITQNFVAPTSIIGDGTRTKEESGSS
jgi:hypothetical protein